MLGRHDGIARYTVGQGKRLGAASVDRGDRQVVVALEPERRRVVVGPRDAGCARRSPARGELAGAAAGGPLRCQVKLRAREAPQPATVEARLQGAEVQLDAARAACARPGLRVL